MPCFTVQTVKLEIKDPRFEYLDDAARTLGMTTVDIKEPGKLTTARCRSGRVYAARIAEWAARGNVNGVQATITFGRQGLVVKSGAADPGPVANEFRRAYTTAIVKAAAAKHQWNFSQAKDGKIYLQNLR